PAARTGPGSAGWPAPSPCRWKCRGRKSGRPGCGGRAGAGCFAPAPRRTHSFPTPPPTPRPARQAPPPSRRRGCPPPAGPVPALPAERWPPWLAASWLSDEQLFAPGVPLRAAATRARWRVDACRLAVALALYQLQEGRPAIRLEDLVPKYLPQLPPDP